jgi:putative SOS response-associated peptidase YedK
MDLGLELVPMRWGFLPGWSTRTHIRPINARAETVATNRCFGKLLAPDGHWCQRTGILSGPFVDE